MCIAYTYDGYSHLLNHVTLYRAANITIQAIIRVCIACTYDGYSHLLNHVTLYRAANITIQAIIRVCIAYTYDEYSHLLNHVTLYRAANITIQAIIRVCIACTYDKYPHLQNHVTLYRASWGCVWHTNSTQAYWIVTHKSDLSVCIYTDRRLRLSQTTASISTFYHSTYLTNEMYC